MCELIACQECIYWTEFEQASHLGKCGTCGNKEHLDTYVISASRNVPTKILFKHDRKCCYGMRKE